MLYVRGSWLLRRFVLPLTLVAFLSACTKWVALEPQYAPSQGEYEKLRITGDDGTRVVIHDPQIEADSLRGTVSDSDQVAAIPIDSVQKIEKRGANWLATAGLAYLAFNVVLGIGLLIECSSNPEGMFC
jgi:hypothetical protein